MDAIKPSTLKPTSDPLAQFRRQATPAVRKVPPLSRRERYVLYAVAPLILLCPWHAGSMLWWSNLANLALALLPVIAALMPLKDLHDEPVRSDTPAQVLKKLLKFPFFWIGLLFLGYIAIQNLNYNWELVWAEGKRGFYMRQLPPHRYIHWLPSGMNAPFAAKTAIFSITNGWQALIMWAVPWLAVCAMWSAFKRRKAWCIVLWMIAALGALLTVLAIAADLSAPTKIFWIWDRKGTSPFGPFTYRNQGSTLLYMAVASSAALFFHYQRTQHIDTGIQWFAGLLGLISLIGSCMSFSRAGWIGTGVILLAIIALFALRVLWQRDFYLPRLLLQLAIFVLLCAGLAFVLAKVDFTPITKKWHQLAAELQGNGKGDYSLKTRQRVAAKTLEMFNDNRLTGWGANSFKYYFPVYQQTDDVLTHPPDNYGRPNKSKRLFWENAHSDWAQLLAEYGIIGCALLLAGLLYFWGSTLWKLPLMHCEHWILLTATATMIAQASLDIVFYNPVLVIIFALVLSATRGMLIQPPKVQEKVKPASL